MQGSMSNILKLLNKSKSPSGWFLCLFLFSGCANAPIKKAGKQNDAMSSVSSKTQDAWEKQDHTASADFHFALAQAYSSEGKVESAIEEYRAALAYDSNSPIIHTKLAAEYLRKGSTSFAVEECGRAIQIDPHSIDARLILGGIYSVSSDPEKAIHEYEEILKIDPRNDEAAVFKTQSLVEKENLMEALIFIRKFVKKVDDSAAAWFYAGKLEQLKGSNNAAVADLRKALEIRPGFAQATIALGMILESMDEVAKAQEVYEDHLEQKQDATVAGRLAALYLKQEQMDQALKVLNIMAILDPEDLNTQMKIGLVNLQKQDWVNSEKTFKGILEKVPDSDKAHYYLSATYEEMGKINESIDHLLKISPDSKLFEDANIHVALVFKKIGKSERAYEVIKDAIKKAPETSGFYIMMASLHEDAKELKSASDVLNEGLRLFPENEKMRYFYGALLDKQAKQDEAVEEMEKILKINPNHADALNYVAYTWTSQGVRLQDAEEMLKRAVKLKPDSPFILDSMGWNQFRLGKQESALRYLEKAVSLKADEQAILEHLVEVYARNQMPERAQATRMKIKKLMIEDVGLRTPASINP